MKEPESNAYQSYEECYQQKYFEVIDTAVMGLQNRFFNQHDIKKQVLPENVLIKRENFGALESYSEIHTS